jgi:hypothetical protein
MHLLTVIMPVHLWTLSSMLELSYFGLWISKNKITLFCLSLVWVRENHDTVKQKFIVKSFLNVISWWNVSVRIRNLEAPFPYTNYICESLCVVWLINSGLTAVRIMCLFLYNGGLKWLLMIVTKEFLLLKDLSLSPKDGNSLQIAYQFECCYASESSLPFSLCCHLCYCQRHKLRCEPVLAP